MLRALEAGADGVMIAGCLEGECHFLSGNIKARDRITRIKQLLAKINMDPDRVEMFNLSSAMGPRFAEIAHEMSERIQALGPSPIPKSCDAVPALEDTSTAA